MQTSLFQNNDCFLDPSKIHASWNSFLTPENRQLILDIKKCIRSAALPFTPEPGLVLRFFQVPLAEIKIIILGQDPYPQPDIATGRAFEVNGLKSWLQTYKNISLKNIVRLIYKTYTGETCRYEHIKKQIATGKFNIAPPGKLFENWEKQGVLLLNTSFTCQVGKPGSHAEIWESFTGKLLDFLSAKKNITWFLWGQHAIDATHSIPIEQKIITFHPMMCFDKPGRELDFLYGKTNPFEQTRETINWLGL